VDLVEQRFLPDHDDLQGGTLFEGLSDDLPIIVTGKDWVKLRERPEVDPRLIIAEHSVSIEPEGAFRTWLLSTLHETKSPRTQ
jgi:tetraacyldisaccharide 4'-kinase